MLNNTADEHSIPLLLCNHGGGDDPVQAVDELGWLKLAGEERIAIIAQRHTSEIPGSSIFDGSPFDTMSDVLPQMVRYMLETYPAPVSYTHLSLPWHPARRSGARDRLRPAPFG